MLLCMLPERLIHFLGTLFHEFADLLRRHPLWDGSSKTMYVHSWINIEWTLFAKCKVSSIADENGLLKALIFFKIDPRQVVSSWRDTWLKQHTDTLFPSLAPTINATKLCLHCIMQASFGCNITMDLWCQIWLMMYDILIMLSTTASI